MKSAVALGSNSEICGIRIVRSMEYKETVTIDDHGEYRILGIDQGGRRHYFQPREGQIRVLSFEDDPDVDKEITVFINMESFYEYVQGATGGVESYNWVELSEPDYEELAEEYGFSFEPNLHRKTGKGDMD